MTGGRLLREVGLGVKNLTLHKTRSLLTMLGVVFGVSSVIAMLAVGEGASRQALEQIRRLGSHNILLTSQKPPQARNREARVQMDVYGLTYDDADRLREGIPSLRRLVPVKVIQKEGRLAERALELRVVGTAPDWFELVRRPTVAGRTLGERDMKDRAAVVVLTEYGARRLLANTSTIGQPLKIGADWFTVVGIVQSEGASQGELQTPDREVDAYVPLSTARERFGDIFARRQGGTRLRELVELHMVIAEARTQEEVESSARAIEAALRRFHPEEDWRISVPLALLRQAEATRRTFTVVLGSIAAISLLVGGIGIMNIMLASVTERTREIGVRRAVGAKRRQIVGQFLVEATVLSTIGGGIGIALGLVIPWAVTALTGTPTTVLPGSLILSLGISLGVGIVFGIYPALRAARLDPIQALRHE